jgi:hypothetical protein
MPSSPPRLPSPSSTRSGRRYRVMASEVAARPDLLSSHEFPPLSASLRSTSSPSCSNDATAVPSASFLPPSTGSNVNVVINPSCNLNLPDMDSVILGNVNVDASSDAPLASIAYVDFGVDSGTPTVRQNASDNVGIVPTVLSTGVNLLASNSLCVDQRPVPVDALGTVACRPAAPSKSVPKTWSSLFTSKPRNAGVYEPVDFVIVEENGVMIPPPCVMQAGLDFWSEYVVGFFLDPNHRLRDVVSVCRRAWRLQGGLRVKLVDSMYYLLFSSPEERSRVLESEPSFFDGQPFIITPWSATVASAREQVFSIPVWVYFSQIPSALQPLRGLNWLACNVGKLICFDSNTVARDKLVYAKALIEISPHRPLPSSIPVQLAIGHVVEVRVRYGWVPDICTSCHSFGHVVSACKHSSVAAAAPKIPLPKPPLRQWIPKVASVPDERPVSPIPAAVPSVLSAEPILSPPLIVWAETEHCWVDSHSAMRFNPVDVSYFRYVSNDPLDLRCLYYKISGDSMVLDLDGSYSEINTVLLTDTAWDRSFIHSVDVDCFVPSLALRFRPFFGHQGCSSLDASVVDERVGDSSSSEEN